MSAGAGAGTLMQMHWEGDYIRDNQGEGCGQRVRGGVCNPIEDTSKLQSNINFAKLLFYFLSFLSATFFLSFSLIFLYLLRMSKMSNFF